MNVFDYVAECLKRQGVEWLACFPSNPIIEAVAKLNIRPIAFRHERGAVMAADGYSRVSDRKRFGVVAMQSQAGAENAMGGLAQANADNIPILVLPEGNALSMVNVTPNFFATRSWRDVCKSAEFVSAPEQTAAVMRRAWHGLFSGRPGPMVVELPIDVCDKEVPVESQTFAPPRAITAQPSSGDIRDAAKALVAAERPLIWSGGGVLFAGATQVLGELAELLDIPVYTTMQGKSSIDERHPLSLGAGGLTVTGPARQWLDDCDVLLALGSSMTKTFYGQSIPAKTFLIQNVINTEELNKDESVDVGLLGDCRLTIEALIEEVKALIGEQPRVSGVRELIAQSKTQWLAQWQSYLVDNDEPISPYRLIHELNQTLDLENSIVTHDAGAPRDQLIPFFTATVPHSYVGWGKTTHLGFGIPLMIGVKLAHPDKFCLNFMGDAAFGMSGLDLETAARAEVPITTLLINNGGMATYPGGFPTARTKYGVSHMQGDYAALARAMGCEGISVKTNADIAPALRHAQQLNRDGKTVLLDVYCRFVDSRAPIPLV